MDNLKNSIDIANNVLNRVQELIEANIRAFEPIKIDMHSGHDYYNSAECKKEYPLASANDEVWTAFMKTEASFVDRHFELLGSRAEYVGATEVNHCISEEEPIYVLQNIPHDSSDINDILIYVISKFIDSAEPLEQILTIKDDKIISTNFRYNHEVSYVLSQLSNYSRSIHITGLIESYLMMAGDLYDWLTLFNQNLQNDLIAFLNNAEIQLQAEQEREENK